MLVHLNFLRTVAPLKRLTATSFEYRSIFKQYAYKNKAKKTAEELIHEDRYGTTVFYDKDKSFKRWLLMKYMFHNYYARYKKYYEVNKGQFFEEEAKKLAAKGRNS